MNIFSTKLSRSDVNLERITSVFQDVARLTSGLGHGYLITLAHDCDVLFSAATCDSNVFNVIQSADMGGEMVEMFDLFGTSDWVHLNDLRGVEQCYILQVRHVNELQ